MKILHMEHLGVVVNDIDVAVARFFEVFGLDFEILNMAELNIQAADGVVPNAPPRTSGIRLAVDASGLFQLLELTGTDEHFHNIHLRVDGIDEAIAELSERGLRLVRRLFVGGLVEAIFEPEDLYGIRVVLVEYAGTSFAAAIRAGSSAPPVYVAVPGDPHLIAGHSRRAKGDRLAGARRRGVPCLGRRAGC